MFLRACTIGLGGILGAAFLLVAPVAADDEEPGYVIVNGKRVLVRLEAAEAGAPSNLTASVGQSRVQPTQARRGSESQARLPRVTVRDLRALDGFYALDDERETFERFLRFRGAMLDQGFPSDGGHLYYHGRYSPYRSFVRDYMSISEYERLRRQRDRNRREMEVRKVRLLTQHEKALHAGLRRLEAGEIERAIVAFTLAAKLNQADPACRIHLAQTRLAQGHYLEAGLALRRALQLQPKLAYADLRLDTYYKDESALSEYTDKLAAWVRENPARAEVHFLLGYLEFQRGDFDAAHTAFGHVSKAMPRDDLTRDYLQITKPAAE